MNLVLRLFFMADLTSMNYYGRFGFCESCFTFTIGGPHIFLQVRNLIL